MDRKPRNFQPQAAQLESKVLLTKLVQPPLEMPPADAEVSITSARSGSTPAAAVTSVVQGRYHAGNDNRAADAPYRVQFQGTGPVDSLGKAKVVGQLDLGGFRAAEAPPVTGTLTLSNARGAVKLRLIGGGDGFAEVPNGKFTTMATVAKATGAYRGFQRIGTVTIDFGADQAPSARAAEGPATVTLRFTPLTK